MTKKVKSESGYELVLYFLTMGSDIYPQKTVRRFGSKKQIEKFLKGEGKIYTVNVNYGYEVYAYKTKTTTTRAKVGEYFTDKDNIEKFHGVKIPKL